MKSRLGKVVAAVVLAGVMYGWGKTARAAGLSVTNGLSAWFDAGTVTAADGAPVLVWLDSSQSGHDAAQTVAGNRPVFKTNVVNGLPAIRFDGMDDVLNYDGTFLANTDYTIFCVEARSSGKTDNYLFGGGVSVVNNNMHLGYRNNTTFTHAHWGNDYNVGIPAFTNKQFKVHSWQFDRSGGSGRAIYTDGALLAQNANTTALVSYPGAMIGGRRTGERFEGDFAEVIMYNRYLDADERNEVGYYLADKYGLTTDYADPGSADIAVSVTSLAGAVVSVGDAVDYTITAVNNGYTNTTVVVSNTIPGMLNFVSASGAAYNDATGEWTVGDLAYPGSTTLTIRATVKTAAAGNGISVEAAVKTSSIDDPNAANNADSVMMHVREEVDPADFLVKMRIDFPGYTRPEILTNFPALIVLNESVPGFSYDLFASKEGHDLRFVAKNGTTVLNHDVEVWNPDGDSLVWVQVDALQAGAYILGCWNNPALTTPPASMSNGQTWAEGYAGVWHLGEDAASADALDAAVGANHGAQTGMPDTVTAMVGGGRAMADDAQFTVGDGVDLSGKPFTVSVWANRATGSTGDDMWVGGGVNQLDSGLHLGFRNANLWFGLYGDDGTCTNDYYADRGAWHYYSMVLDENHGKQIYRDGMPVPTSGASNDFYQSSGLLIGGTYAGLTYRGELDEVRASVVDRSASWVWAEWMTVASNDAFTTYSEVFGLPVLANAAVTGVTDVAAFANGDLSFTGAAPTTVTLFWGESDGGAAWGAWANTNVLGVLSAAPLSTPLTGLSASTGYAYAYHALNTYGETWATPSTVFTSRMATFWTITPSSGPNGAIAPSSVDTVNHAGDSALYTFLGDDGYHLTNILVDTTLVGPGNSYRFVNVTADHSIKALFGINHYTVTVAQAANGLISPTGSVVVAHGDSPSYTIEPTAGYYVEDVIVGGVSAGPLEAYTVAGATNSQTITAVFAELPMDMSTDGLVLWLDGSKLSQADGSTVAEWLDYSGRGNHARQSAKVSMPQYYNDNLGPHVYFNGAKYMELLNESDFNFTTNATIIMVGRNTSGGAWTPYISKNGEPSGWQFREAGNRNVLSFTTRGLTGGDTDDPEGSGDIQVESVLAGRYDGATSTKQVWYNGALEGTLVYSGGQISTNDSAVVLGARDNGGIGGYAQCDIYELLVYDDALTDTELNAVGYYLAGKYGIQSDYTHPREPTVAASKSPMRTTSSALLEGTLVSTGTAPTSVWAYWDTADQGTNNRMAWAGSVALGEQTEGYLSANATGLKGDTDYSYRLFASNVNGMAWSGVTSFESGVAPGNYTNSLKIQFTGYSGTTPLTNFPALVALSPSVTNFSYSSFASPTGGDLRFTDAGLSKTLNYEVENWVPDLKSQDVGAVGAAGSLSVSGSTYTVVGSGADIWGTVDEFHYAYTTLSGDGSITARVRDIANPGGNEWCKSGIMIRETLAANSAFGSLIVRTDGQTYFMYRASPGAGAAAAAGLAAGPIPGWLRLVRSGSNFMGYVSSDGVSWTLRGDVNVTMATNVLIGLAVTSHADGQKSTVNFDNVSIDIPNSSHVWVQVPEIASSEDYIWAFWGNPSRVTPPIYTTDGSTWSDNFGAVWHMTEPNASDSTVNDHDGVANGNYDGVGLIAGAQTFTNLGNIAVNTGIDLSSRSFSFEAWSKRSAVGDNDFIAGQGPGPASQMLHIGFRNTEVFAFAFYSDDLNIGGPWNDTTSWHHWACVYDAATKKQEVFRDGVSLNTRTAADHFLGSGVFYIGARGGGTYTFQGEIDEVRLSNLTLSQDWVVASHSNQVAGSSFVTYSADPAVAPLAGMLIIVR